jgi:hypothetical protein
MDDLERQLNRYAGQLDLPEPVSADEVFDRSADHRPGSHRAFLVAAALLVVVLLGGAVVALVGGSDGDDQPPVAPVDTAVTTTPLAPLRARIELPVSRMRSDEQMQGEVVVDNDTGVPIQTEACGLFNAVVFTGEFPDDVLVLLCRIPYTIPPGESRWPLVVFAWSRDCGEPIEDCPRLLPAGNYQVGAVAPNELPRPESVTIEIVEP